MDNVAAAINIIPSLAEVINYCLKYIKNETFNINFLPEKLKLDVGISAKILLLAYSRSPKDFDHINDFQKAVGIIGINEIIRLLENEYEAHKLTKVENEFFNLREFNRHSYFVSRMAVELGKLVHIKNTNDLMLAGLFHDIGLIIRTTSQSKIMLDIIDKCKFENIDFYAAEKSIDTTTHDALGKKITKKWGLSDKALFLIEHHHTPEAERMPELVQFNLELDLLMLSDTIAHSMTCGFRNYNRENKVSKLLLQKLNLNPEEIAEKSKDILGCLAGTPL